MGLFRRTRRRVTRAPADEEHPKGDAPETKSTVDDFEVPGNLKPDRRCSDNECPCGSPGASIPHGAGYMYISEDVVKWRRDARSAQESERKAQKLQKKARMPVMFDQDMIAPTLMCEKGARRRGLDLEVAAADARYWWETGRAPLRVTPLARSRH
jgi:hypothetical protein